MSYRLGLMLFGMAAAPCPDSPLFQPSLRATLRAMGRYFSLPAQRQGRRYMLYEPPH
jgi:hypothetical protein